MVISCSGRLRHKSPWVDGFYFVEGVGMTEQDLREACAKVCSEMYLEGDMNTGLAANLIRARSQS